MISAKAPPHDTLDWLPTERLGERAVDAKLRPWLIAKGLLTTRLKAHCGDRFEMRLRDQFTGLLGAEHKRYLRAHDGAGLFREVQMLCDGRVWVFAQTVMPDSTLDKHPWLAELGDSALDETLAALSGVERSSYEYAWLPTGAALAARAFEGRPAGSAGLWARRSRFSLRTAPLLVQEVFLPAMGGC